VQAGPDGVGRFAATCRLIREKNAAWLAASPTNLTIEHTVRFSEGGAWISIQNAIDDELLRRLSVELDTRALTIYAIDEKILTFSFLHVHRGRTLRELGYTHKQRPDGRDAWTTVAGEREAWEDVLFSPRLMELYRMWAADEVAEACRDRTIKIGHSIPWACDGDVVRDIAERLQLPWNPYDDTFPPATQTEVIPGSPERWKEFHRSQRRPWWKLW
jgi:hypothetical protein